MTVPDKMSAIKANMLDNHHFRAGQCPCPVAYFQVTLLIQPLVHVTNRRLALRSHVISIIPFKMAGIELLLHKSGGVLSNISRF